MRQRLLRPHLVSALTLAALTFLANAAWAAITGKIVGTVRDNEGNPLPGTSVFVEGRTLGATTDADGRYFILQVPPGAYTLEARLVGFQPVRQQNVLVNVDRTTEVSFRLQESAIEVEAITIIAERPVVETDVTSTQIFITTKQAQDIPVNTLLDAIGFQPGIDIVNKTAISVRGSTPDEISFQVDGFEQTNALENRSYTAINQAMVQEVQVLTGAFSAEYFSRAAVINVVTKDPGQIPSVTGDFRVIPARRQHFGVGAYDDDQMDRLVYKSDGTISTDGRVGNKNADGTLNDKVNADLPVYFVSTAKDNTPETAAVFEGWNSVFTKIDAAKASYLTGDATLNAHRGYWTKDALKEMWDWQHRPYDYAKDGDYYLDMAVSTPLYIAPRTGIVFGFKDVRSVLPFPAVVQNFTDRVYEGTFKSLVIPAIKLEARLRYEVSRTTVQGVASSGYVGSGTTDLAIFYSGTQSSIVGSTVGGGGSTLIGGVLNGLAHSGGEAGYNKYNLNSNVPYEETIKGGGVRLTHTLTPSTYYTFSFEYLGGKVDAHPGTPRKRDSVYTINITSQGLVGKLKTDVPRLFITKGLIDTAGVGGGTVASSNVKRDTTISVRLDETPRGMASGAWTGIDVASKYYLSGGAYVSDYSEWATSKLRFDAFSQINANHGAKLGAEYRYDNLIRDFRRQFRHTGSNGAWDRYEANPWQVGFYLQDKMEYEGLVANFGARLDGYNANWWVFFPDSRFPDEYQRGFLMPRIYIAMATGGIPAEYWVGDSLYKFDPSRVYTWGQKYIDSSRSVDPTWKVWELVESIIPRKKSQTFWRAAPRVGISHPIGTTTKFFFNFGWMYSLPKSGYRYGMYAENAQIGSPSSEIRGVSNPDLAPPRSVVYEVGFEQSILNDYVARVKGYSKDDEDEPGTFTRVGKNTARSTGGPGRVGVRIAAIENTQYQSTRGLEITLEKARGRFITGSFNFDFRVLTIGQNGFSEEYEDARAKDAPAGVVINQPQFQPIGKANIVLRTPSDWGIAAGNWALSLQEDYARGTKVVYYPGGEQANPKVFRWIDTWRTNLRLTKDIVVGGRSVSFYADVRNALNQKTLNTSAIVDSRVYYEELLMENNEPKYKVGDTRFNDVVKRRLVRDNEWVMFLDPREFQFGVRVSL